MRSRSAELLNLLARRLWWLVAGVILGVLGITQALSGAIHQGYLLALAAAGCLVIALLLVAYQLLGERERGRAPHESTTIIQHHHHYGGENGPTFIEPSDANVGGSTDSTP